MSPFTEIDLNSNGWDPDLNYLLRVSKLRPWLKHKFSWEISIYFFNCYF